MIQGITRDAVFPETLAELWETILWICVLSEIRSYGLLSSEELHVINPPMVGSRARHGEWCFETSNLFDEVMKKTPDGLPNLMLDVTFDDAKSIVVGRLRSSKKSFVILMDSLDDFHLDIDSVSHSLQGLLKFVGSMNKPRDVVDIRFCLPSELFRQIIKISSNPNKDFRRALKLQWTASELVLIVWRLMYYLALYYPGFLKGMSQPDLTKRADALMLLAKSCPVSQPAGFQKRRCLVFCGIPSFAVTQCC
jgi:hypothetical protein